MSVTAESESRYRTNVLTVPLQSVTTRLPKEAKEKLEKQKKQAADTRDPDAPESEAVSRRRQAAAPKATEVVVSVKDGKAVMGPVKRGISDDDHTEILEGVQEDLDVVSGGYKAIARELEDGKQAKVDNTVRPFTRRDEEKKNGA